MTQLLRENIESHACTTMFKRDNFGTVTLFRAYPGGVNTFKSASRRHGWHGQKKKVNNSKDK
jgi:hypothetical protein